MSNAITIIGLISDTHGLLRKSALDALGGVDMILHAGDIDNILVIEELELIAPVHAVRGNMDFKPGVAELPNYLKIKAGPANIGVVHDRHRLANHPSAEGISVIVHGHTHKAAIEETGGILYVNPGSAGPKRSNRQASVGILNVRNGKIIPTIVPLAD
ncbi:MAG: metallophosphoesterase [Desulfosalsimonadaceae bacterium]